MRHVIGFALVAALLSGCAVYAEPYPYGGPPVAAGVVVGAPVVVAPVHHGWWHAGRFDYRHRG